MGVLKEGESLHIVEKRFFADDVRRHFIGTVKEMEGNILRMEGYVWVFDKVKHRFSRRQEKRERIFVLGDRHIINIIPKGVNLSGIDYKINSVGQMVITDGFRFKLDLSEFVSI